MAKLSDRDGMECRCTKRLFRDWLRDNPLIIATICAVVLGMVVGFSFRSLSLSDDAIAWIEIWGELFLRMLKMLILPLTVCSLVVGIASMKGGFSGKLGGITLAYIFLTQLVSTIIGAIMVAVIQPGAGFGDLPPEGAVLQSTSYTTVFTDLLRNLFPDNIVQACIESVYTSIQSPQTNSTAFTSLLDNQTTNGAVKKLLHRNGMNILGLLTFSGALGAAISAAGNAGKPLYNLFASLNEVIMKMMMAVIWYSPIGIFSLIASALLRVDSIEDALHSVGLFVGTVVAGCFIHQLVILPAIFAAICRKNPYKYFLDMIDVFLASCAPPSDALFMPYFLRSCPEKFGIDRRVAQFVVPIEVTINRDGSALFIYVVTLFAAQSYSIVLGVGYQVMLVFLVSILVATAAAIPSASIVVIMMLAPSVGIPIDGRIGLILAVEWLTDRVRTSTNVVSHGYGCAIIDCLYRKYVGGFEESPGPEVELKINGMGDVSLKYDTDQELSDECSELQHLQNNNYSIHS